MSSCAASSWGRPTASSPSSPRGTARSEPSPRACASPAAGSGRGSSPRPTWRSSATGAAATSTSSPRWRPSTPTARCGSTTAASPTRCRCWRPPTRSRRTASRTPPLYRMLVGALRTLAAEPSPLVSAAFFWKLLALEGFHPLLDVCARCGNESGAFPAFDLLEGGVLCETCGSLARTAPPTRVAGAAPPDPGRRAADRARRATQCGHDRHRAPRARRHRAPHRTSPAQRRAPRRAARRELPRAAAECRRTRSDAEKAPGYDRFSIWPRPT